MQQTLPNIEHNIQQNVQYAEVCGKIVYVNKKNRKSKIFSIYAEGMDKKFRCIYNKKFFPIVEGDDIYWIAEYKSKAFILADLLSWGKPGSH